MDSKSHIKSSKRSFSSKRMMSIDKKEGSYSEIRGLLEDSYHASIVPSEKSSKKSIGTVTKKFQINRKYKYHEC
jgi:hypothetical protein